MYHHSPATEAEEWAVGFLIKAANTIAHQVAQGNGGWIGDCSDEDAMNALGISPEEMQTLMQQVAETSIAG
jgi:hypothetical protein